jgi:ABC-2 type transport system ATP-binding protein
VIEVRGLTKRYGSTVAVDRLSFDVPPGAVTGFLGLNGSGKSTTMRMILGLDAPDAGHARIGSQSRVAEVLEIAGLGSAAGKRAGKFSLGMAQRLGIAAALLGDPAVLLLDEPVNGLDPEGIRWIRGLLRSLAAEGRAVLVSSHLISEMALMADRLVVIGQGRLLADTTAAELSSRAPSLEEAFLQLTGDSAQYQARNMS